MRSYLTLNADGTFGSGHAANGGFLPENDLTDPNSTSPVVANVKQLVAARGETPQGWVAYDCPCPSHVTWCSCVHHRVNDSYLANGNVVLKPGRIGYGGHLLIDGVRNDTTTYQVPASLLANSTHTLQYQCADIPDGHTITVMSAPELAPLINAPVTLTFTGGITNTVTFTVPPQMTSGCLLGKSKYVGLFNLFIRGV